MASTCGSFRRRSQGGVTHTDQTQELCRGVRQSSGSGSAAASQFQRRLDQMISVHNQIYICIYEHQTSKELTFSPSAAFPAFLLFPEHILSGGWSGDELDKAETPGVYMRMWHI